MFINLNSGLADFVLRTSFHARVDLTEKKADVHHSLGVWLMKELTMAPNAVSLARLISGPCIATLIIYDAWSIATVSLLFAGVSCGQLLQV